MSSLHTDAHQFLNLPSGVITMYLVFNRNWSNDFASPPSCWKSQMTDKAWRFPEHFWSSAGSSSSGITAKQLCGIAVPAGLQTLVWVSSFSRGPGWHLRKLSFLRTSITPSWARTSHLSRLALALELNELQSGSSVQHHWVFESSLWKEDFLTWLFRTQQGWGKVTGNASGRTVVRGFLKKNVGKRAENENAFF